MLFIVEMNFMDKYLRVDGEVFVMGFVVKDSKLFLLCNLRFGR